MSVLKTYGTDNSWHPSLTYQLNGNRIEGKVDGLDAVMQAVELILKTERFRSLAYSWDYGVEFETLIGQDRRYLEADLKRRILEALSEDDRILGIQGFQLSFERESANVSFTVLTVFGSFLLQRSVDIGRSV